MNKLIRIPVFMSLVAAVLLVASPPSAVAGDGDFAFFTWVPGKSIATDPGTGETLELKVQGSFDLIAGTIVGGGGYVHRDATGILIQRDRVRPTQLTDFELLSASVPLGIGKANFLGGIFRFDATFDPPPLAFDSPTQEVIFYCRFRVPRGVELENFLKERELEEDLEVSRLVTELLEAARGRELPLLLPEGIMVKAERPGGAGPVAFIPFPGGATALANGSRP